VTTHLRCEFCKEDSEAIATGSYHKEYPFSELEAAEQDPVNFYYTMVDKMKTLVKASHEKLTKDRICKQYGEMLLFLAKHSTHQITVVNSGGEHQRNGIWYKEA